MSEENEPENLGIKKVVYTEDDTAKPRKIIGEVIKEKNCIRITNERGTMILGWRAVLAIKNAPSDEEG